MYSVQCVQCVVRTVCSAYSVQCVQRAVCSDYIPAIHAVSRSSAAGSAGLVFGGWAISVWCMLLIDYTFGGWAMIRFRDTSTCATNLSRCAASTTPS
jgi:hypothetical protein